MCFVTFWRNWIVLRLRFASLWFQFNYRTTLKTVFRCWCWLFTVSTNDIEDNEVTCDSVSFIILFSVHSFRSYLTYCKFPLADSFAWIWNYISSFLFSCSECQKLWSFLLYVGLSPSLCFPELNNPLCIFVVLYYLCNTI